MIMSSKKRRIDLLTQPRRMEASLARGRRVVLRRTLHRKLLLVKAPKRTRNLQTLLRPLVLELQDQVRKSK
jgi:hypothetical protein